MKHLHVSPKGAFEVSIDTIASDKSISHRCALFPLLCAKPSYIEHFLEAEDTLCTLAIVQKLGAKVVVLEDGRLEITPPQEIIEPSEVLDCGNAGTAIRLLMGFLASQKGFFVLSGDRYLCARPMRRVADPLRAVGAQIDGRTQGNYAPLAIRGNTLKAFRYESKISSAQVKSALILAALQADGISHVSEPELSRDHSERMLVGMGARIERDGLTLAIHPQTKPLSPLNMRVPSDPSSGFFFAVAAAIHEGATVTLRHMLLNPTRIKAYHVLARMGAEVSFEEESNTYESVGTIRVRGRGLHGVEVEERMAWLIDELPALSIAFACAKGESVVRNASELRVKESDRISTVVRNLKACGIEAEEFEDGYTVIGGVLRPASITSFGDHRVAMSFAIAGTKAAMQIEDTECINTSFPNFTALLSLIAKVEHAD